MRPLHEIGRTWRCSQRIVLDGVRYVCTRTHVDGYHDAGRTHAGPSGTGRVRW